MACSPPRGRARLRQSPAGLHSRCASFSRAGSFVFATSGYANPNLTIVALSLRLANHLQETMQRGL
jgi:hypothetical protein